MARVKQKRKVHILMGAGQLCPLCKQGHVLEMIETPDKDSLRTGWYCTECDSSYLPVFVPEREVSDLKELAERGDL